MFRLQLKVKRKYAKHAMTSISEFAETDVDESDDEEKLAKHVYRCLLVNTKLGLVNFLVILAQESSLEYFYVNPSNCSIVHTLTLTKKIVSSSNML